MTSFPFLFKRDMKVVFLGSFNDCVIWTPSQRTLQFYIKLWQLIIWVTKDQGQSQKQCNNILWMP